MYLSKLNLSNFKNYHDLQVVFNEKINCFVGMNGAGKTNLLDAIYYLSFCKSYFNPADTQNIRHQADFFAIHGTFSRNHALTDTVSCIQKRNTRKQFKINQKEYERFSDHIGLFPVVMISPYDKDLINEGSEERRKYFDSVISQFDKNYLDTLISYNKALLQRNTLLKKIAESNILSGSEIEIWDEQLIHLGAAIYKKRVDFLNEFHDMFRYYFSIVSEKKEEVMIGYESHLKDNNYREMLASSLRKDIVLQYTSAGIHKDDMIFFIDGYPVKKFGSQGQQKSYVVALKLAQFEFTRQKTGFKPIMLLDDVFDKLDDRRVEQIIKLISDDCFGQVFITDTQRERVEKIFDTCRSEHEIFEVCEGELAIRYNSGK